MNSFSNYVRLILFAMLMAWFLSAPVYSLLFNGPFMWHIAQPAAWQGFGEVLVLVAIFYLVLGLSNSRLRLLLGGAAAWLYARRHGVDISIAVVYLYAEGILAVGTYLLRCTGFNTPGATNALAAGLVGVIAWSLVIWVSSAFGFGSLEAIRLITIVVLGAALVVSRRTRLATLVARYADVQRPLDRLAVALLGAFFLALFAKASVVVDYDSLWYGLQAEEVLVGEGGLYVDQGLVAVVHHYPKLYEALQLPFAGLGSISMIFGVGIFSWTLVSLTCSAILREFNVSRTLRLWGVALVATLPALANIAVTAKGDMFSAWMLTLATLGLIRYRKGERAWLGMALAAIALAVLSRLSNIPYAAILTLLLAYTFIADWRMNGGVSGLFDISMPVVVAAGALTCMVLARDVLLSGLALIAPDVLVKLQQAAGMELKYPVGLLPAGDGLQRLPFMDGLWGILFDPARYPHLLITWTGNAWAFMFIAAILLGGFGALRQPKQMQGAWPLLLVGLSFFAVMFGYKFLVPAGDGNYFIVPLVCLTLWILTKVNGLTQQMRRPIGASLVLFGFCSAAISFVTGSWGPGTRPIDTNLSRLPFEYSQLARQGIAAAKLGGVAKFLSGMPPGTRVVGFDRANLNTESPAGWWLPVQYEVAQGFGWQNPEIIATDDGFKKFLVEADIQFVLLPKTQSEPTANLMQSVVNVLSIEQSAEIAYQDDHYILWRIKSLEATSTTLTDGGVVRLSLNKEAFCANPANGVVSVSWSGVPGKVAIEVGSPGSKAKLWAETAGTGSMTTGPWMPQGGEFVFKSGRDGKILGTLKVDPNCN